jgi:hypothetical protein
MWLTSKQAILIAIVGVVIGGVTAASAQLRGQPPIVRFTGTFQPFDQKAAGDLNTLTVSYKEHQWLFRVERVKAMGARDSGTMLLSRIFPPQLSLSGPAELLEPLGNPENMGKRWTLEGMLYLRHRRYYVATVEAEPAEPKEVDRQNLSQYLLARLRTDSGREGETDKDDE